jgi:hypothetical protein
MSREGILHASSVSSGRWRMANQRACCNSLDASEKEKVAVSPVEAQSGSSTARRASPTGKAAAKAQPFSAVPQPVGPKSRRSWANASQSHLLFRQASKGQLPTCEATADTHFRREPEPKKRKTAPAEKGRRTKEYSNLHCSRSTTYSASEVCLSGLHGSPLIFPASCQPTTPCLQAQEQKKEAFLTEYVPRHPVIHLRLFCLINRPFPPFSSSPFPSSILPLRHPSFIRSNESWIVVANRVLETVKSITLLLLAPIHFRLPSLPLHSTRVP